MDSSEGFDYQEIVQEALRAAVRRVLLHVAEQGLPGEHHFYIGFRTTDPGILMPPGLRQQYPREMTVILQNQFWDLEVDEGSFSVSLTFNGARQRLTVPFASLTTFVDPSAQFGLRFDGDAETETETAEEPTLQEGEGKSDDPPRKIGRRAGRKAPAEAPAGRSKPAKETRGAVVPFDPSRRR